MLLELEDLSVRYGKVEAVNHLSMKIVEGQVVALLGANGSGKTSTAKAISRMVNWSSGDVRFKGRSISNCSPSDVVRLGIAQVPEGRMIFPDLTVRENLLMGGFTRKPDIVRRQMELSLSIFPILKERLKQKAGTLSGGEQQMLAISRALMVQPKLLILDEPSLGLSPIMIQTIYQNIAELVSNETGILLVEQNVQQALKVSDYVYVLQHGRVVLEGCSTEFRDASQLLDSYLK